MTDAKLIDIPMEGYPFTWIRGKGTEREVEEHLDRTLATREWLDRFPNCLFLNCFAYELTRS